MWVDKGKEFYNTDVKNLIELYSTENEEKSRVVERWIRTMKEKMWKYFQLTLRTSTSAHYRISSENITTPDILLLRRCRRTRVKQKTKLCVWRNLYPNNLEIDDIRPEFSVGDKVRISKKKKTFEKGYTTRWTEEIFMIIEVKRTLPVTYGIADLNGEEMTGIFYEPEMQKTSQELFRIEKVIRRGKKKSQVKWKGYSDDFDSCVDNRDIVNIS